MKKRLVLILKVVGVFIVLVGLGFAGLLTHGTVTDYTPPELEKCEVMHPESADAPVPDTLDLLIWNIGYAGLGKEMDFFYDEGEKVRPTPEQSTMYLEGILNKAKEYKDYDFLMFQEVDTFSERSYDRNIYRELDRILPGHTASYAANYNVDFLPMPFTEPLGRIRAGLATFSIHKPTEVVRHQFPGNYDWPKKVYLLDRCFMESRFSLPNGKELILINTHNSAYDDGTLKQQQMDFLKDFLLNEYENNGNYVIVGGDWNQCPPNFDPNTFNKGEEKVEGAINVDPDYLPENWVWAYDPWKPTNRKLNKPFQLYQSGVTLIDYYLLSPNVHLLDISTQSMDFEYSDHEPVAMKVSLEMPIISPDTLSIISDTSTAP